MKYQLDKSVIKSEFPNLELQSKHRKKVAFTLKGGQDIVIGKEKDNGDYDSELYEFSNVDDNLVWPTPPDLPNYWHDVDLDKWNGVIDSNFKDSLNSNNDQIQKSINSLYEYETDQRNFFAKLKDTLSDFKGFVETIISAKTAEFLSKFSDQYYKKDEIDDKVRVLQSQIDHLKNENSTSNGIKKPGVF